MFQKISNWAKWTIFTSNWAKPYILLVLHLLLLGLWQCLNNSYYHFMWLRKHYTQNYFVFIPSNMLRFPCLYRSCFTPSCTLLTQRWLRQTQFWKKYYCRNYSDDICQCLNTGHILLQIKYFDHNTVFKKFLNKLIKSAFIKYSAPTKLPSSYYHPQFRFTFFWHQKFVCHLHIWIHLCSF